MMEFRRLTKTYTKVIMWAIYIILAAIIVLEKINGIFNIPENFLQCFIKVLVFILPVIIIVGCFLPPNFEYNVLVQDNIIIFEFAEDDYRVISTSFNIMKKGMYYILLDDGYARLMIPYNKEFLVFLRKNQNNLFVK